MKILLKVIKHLYLAAIAVVVIFPVLYVILASFKTNIEILANPAGIFPREFTLDNYVQAWTSDNFNLGPMLFNSVYFTMALVIITVVMSALGGYVFARGRFRGKNFWYTLFTMLMFVQLGSITMYPAFQVVEFVGIPKSLPGLIFKSCFALPAANCWLVTSYIKGIPFAVDEAAKIDGCTFTQIFYKIIIHQISPILITIAMTAFNGSWNAYLEPLIWTMSNPEQRPLIVGVMALKSSGEAATSWNLMLAGSTVALIPVLIIYMFGNKYIVKGLSAGAVKG